MQYDKVDPATCQCISYYPQATPPRTNADRIRAMDDEELELRQWYKKEVHKNVKFMESEGLRFSSD